MKNVTVRRATADDADELASLLHAFNSEFDTPSPGPSVLAPRLRVLLASPMTFALLAGAPAVGFALVTLRTNVWYDGHVALLDELYVEPTLRSQGIGAALMAELLVQATALGVDLIEINVDESDVDALRFYVRQGYSATDLDTGERAFYISRELSN
jgi:ribosomal protein S18 acetylase RimI-like enzyme